jgi:hypothetical protein
MLYDVLLGPVGLTGPMVLFMLTDIIVEEAIVDEDKLTALSQLWS